MPESAKLLLEMGLMTMERCLSETPEVVKMARIGYNCDARYH